MLEIRLIGQPDAVRSRGDSYRPRSRKSWAVLTYLLFSDVQPTRSHLASLLFSEAKDPLRALRWSLSELRRLLGPDAQIEGDPLSLRLPENTRIDVQLITGGRWQHAIELPRLGEELLAGFDFSDSPHFESWLLAMRRHVAAATEDLLREACLAYLGRGEPARAIPWAVLLVGLNPYVEHHQALLIRSYALAGDAVAADRQFRACVELYARELGVPPGPLIQMAALTRPEPKVQATGDDAVRAAIESGTGSIAAGAVEAGVNSLRLSLALADAGDNLDLQARARLGLAESLIHSVRGVDEEGAELLHGAMEIARKAGIPHVELKARVELGYTDMLAGRYDRAERWLNPNELAGSDEETRIRALTYSGVVESDCARYARAESLLQSAVKASRTVGLRRREAYAVSMLGRLAFLLGDLNRACELLEHSIGMAEADSWIAFLPWPQAFLGESLIERGDTEAASRVLHQAFARACQIGDPCWEGVTGRALALLVDAEGDPTEATRIVKDALARCQRLPDTYRWAEAHVLEAQCHLGVVHGLERASGWTDQLYDIATRTGMRELQLRAMLLRERIGGNGDEGLMASLAEAISNPRFLSRR